jgi:hypothetical protein
MSSSVLLYVPTSLPPQVQNKGAKKSWTETIKTMNQITFYCFFFFFWQYWTFELRASHLIGRCSITQATSQCFCFSCFSDRVLPFLAQVSLRARFSYLRFPRSCLFLFLCWLSCAFITMWKAKFGKYDKIEDRHFLHINDYFHKNSWTHAPGSMFSNSTVHESPTMKAIQKSINQRKDK